MGGVGGGGLRECKRKKKEKGNKNQSDADGLTQELRV